MANTKNHALLSDEFVLMLIIDLCATFFDISSTKEVADILSTLLTPQEIRMLAIRLHIGKMLSKGSSYEEIKRKLNVSSATISRVRLGRELSNDRPRANRVVAKRRSNTRSSRPQSSSSRMRRGKYTATTLWPIEALSQVMRYISEINPKE